MRVFNNARCFAFRSWIAVFSASLKLGRNELVPGVSIRLSSVEGKRYDVTGSARASTGRCRTGY